MITADDLRSYIGATDADDTFLDQCIASSYDLLNAYLGQVTLPEDVSTQVALIVASDMYQRRNAPQGIAQFAAFDGAPVRVPRDPLMGVYPLLDLYVGRGL